MSQEATYQETYPKLFALAYRMTGSVSDAEDVIQEAWIRLLDQPTGKVESPPKWLYRTVSNLSIDAIRSAKRTATGYHGPWLPEPVIPDVYFRGPEAEAIVREDLSMALLLMLENLSPVQRAVWVLRTTLELSFAEIGEIVDRTDQTCRQIFRRANQRLTGSDGQGLTTAPSDMVEAFLGAVHAGDVNKVASLMLDDSTWIGDGGGVKPATMRPVVGADKVARGLTALMGKFAQKDVLYRPAVINGGMGLVIHVDGELDAVYLFLGTNKHISHVLTVRNPHKLMGVTTNPKAMQALQQFG